MLLIGLYVSIMFSSNNYSKKTLEHYAIIIETDPNVHVVHMQNCPDYSSQANGIIVESD